MAPVASHAVLVYLSGTSTPFVDEVGDVISVDTVQVGDAAYRIFDPGAAVSVTVDGQPYDSEVAVDYLFGKVRWLSGTIPAGEVLISANAVPLYEVAQGRSVDVNSAWTELDTSVQGNAHRLIQAGRAQADLSIVGLRLRRDSVDEAEVLESWKELHDDGAPKLVQVDFGGAMWRGWCRFPSLSESAPEDGVVTGTVSAKTISRKALNRPEYVSYGDEE